MEIKLAAALALNTTILFYKYNRSLIITRANRYNQKIQGKQG